MKKIKLVIGVIVVALLLSGCGVDMTGSAYQIHNYVDPQTGVNYVWINTDSGVAICPRYDDDGHLFITKD